MPALCVGFGNHSTTGYCVLFMMPENTVSMLSDGFKTMTRSDSGVFLIILEHQDLFNHEEHEGDAISDLAHGFHGKGRLRASRKTLAV